MFNIIVGYIGIIWSTINIKLMALYYFSDNCFRKSSMAQSGQSIVKLNLDQFLVVYMFL